MTGSINQVPSAAEGLVHGDRSDRVNARALVVRDPDVSIWQRRRADGAVKARGVDVRSEALIDALASDEVIRPVRYRRCLCSRLEP